MATGNKMRFSSNILVTCAVGSSQAVLEIPWLSRGGTTHSRHPKPAREQMAPSIKGEASALAQDRPMGYGIEQTVVERNGIENGTKEAEKGEESIDNAARCTIQVFQGSFMGLGGQCTIRPRKNLALFQNEEDCKNLDHWGQFKGLLTVIQSKCNLLFS